MRARLLTLRMPLDQIALLSFTSTRTSEVFMTFCANFFTCWVKREGRDGSVGVLGKEKSLGLKGEAGPGHHGGRKRLIRRRCGDSIDTNGVARTPSERVRSSAASSTPIGGRHARRRRASRATPTPSPNRGSNTVFWDGTHRLHRTRSPLLEGQSVDRLGEVDGVLAGHDVLSLAHVSRCCAGRIRRAKRARRARCFGKNTAKRGRAEYFRLNYK